MLKRARLLLVAASLIAGPVAAQLFAQSGAPDNAITSVSFGTPWQYNASYPPQTVIGDGWTNTWADDDKTYIVGDDCSRWNDISSGSTSNTKISTVSATDNTAVGTLVSDMLAWGGPPMTTNTGSPSRSHKIGGIISIGSVLYAMDWRLDPNWTTTWGINDGQLLKSINHGVDWTPLPPSTGGQPYAAPMFPGVTIPFAPVQYGKAYAGSGPHNSGTYVYWTVAVGTSGKGSLPTQNPSQMRLARVSLANLTANCCTTASAADWQYWQGGDGMNSANWGSSVTGAANVLDVTDAVGGLAGLATGMQYLPRYNRYLYLATQVLSTAMPLSNIKWLAYICKAPWDCNSSPIATAVYNPQGYYLPGIMPKSLVNGGQQLVTTGAGVSADAALPTGRYTLTYIPITITP